MLHAAVAQMDVAPVPLGERLARAEGRVRAASAAGARLIVLPELFNSGYAYREANYRLAEPPDGPTLSWMHHVAARLDVHLAGSLLLHDGGGIANTMCLVAPDGRSWQYAKRYPWCWEHGYVRRGHAITVAETRLGALGMMVCWDVAHAALWRRYAGRVDAVLVSSSPPDFGRAVGHLANGKRVAMDDLGARAAPLRAMGQRVFARYLRAQAVWLGVPVIAASACGTFHSPLSHGRATMLGLSLLAPRLLAYVVQAGRLDVSCDMVAASQVIDAQGGVVARLDPAAGESCALAEVALARERPAPQGPPPTDPSFTPLYLASDLLMPLLCRTAYRRGLAMLERRPPSSGTCGSSKTSEI
jgi:predicted amidohydrolase